MLFYANKKGIIFRSLKTFLTFKHFHVCFPAISIETLDKAIKTKARYFILDCYNIILFCGYIQMARKDLRCNDRKDMCLCMKNQLHILNIFLR